MTKIFVSGEILFIISIIVFIISIILHHYFPEYKLIFCIIFIFSLIFCVVFLVIAAIQMEFEHD
jgi:hypothetical protein